MIKTIIVDDSIICAETLTCMCNETGELTICGTFNHPEQALAYAGEHKVDAAFLDIEMPEMNGIELGRKLREAYPHMVLIFVTCKEEYCSLAMKMKADFYIFKPFEYADIVDAVERARLLVQRKEEQLRAVMFGRFDVFIKGKAVYFSNAKAKELLALCLDHQGGAVTMEEAVDKLWSEKDYNERTKRLYRKAVGCIKSVMAQTTSMPVFISNRGSCQIVPRYFYCDYYEFLKKKDNLENSRELLDMYLEEYSWSEFLKGKHLLR